MRITHVNKLIFAIRIQTTNFMICLNRLRACRDKWDKLDVVNMTTPPSELIQLISATVKDMLKALRRFRALRNEWDSLDAGTVINDSMIGGDNDGITKAEVSAVIGTTIDNLNILLNAGHGTNLYKVDVAVSSLTKDDVTAVIGVTMDALNSLMAEGHATNCYSIVL